MTKCPRCDFETFGAFRRGRKLFKFNRGDISGCRLCGHVHTWDDENSPRDLTKEEFKKIRSNPEAWRGYIKTLLDVTRFLKKDLK